MKSIKIIKPKFLNFYLKCKQGVLELINNSNLEGNYKKIIQECIIFNCELEKHINKDINFKQINELFNDYIAEQALLRIFMWRKKVLTLNQPMEHSIWKE